MDIDLTSIRMDNLRAHETDRGGVAWRGTLIRNGQPWATVSNAGDGGCHSYRPYKMAYNEFHQAKSDVEKAVATATGLKYEALDLITCYMGDGDSLQQGIDKYLAT